MASAKDIKKAKTTHKNLNLERMDIFQENMDAISTTHLNKSFMGIKAVNDLSISFPKGITTALIGPNGSGKSTLINLLTGMLSPDSGTIVISGRAFPYIKPYNLRKFKIARTFQDARLVEQLNVEDNLLLGIAENTIMRGIKEIGKRKYHEKMEDILNITNLTEHRTKKAEELSYGLRKLLEIGRALMQDADIYIFDEPFTGLSPKIVEEVLSIIENLRNKAKTVILIEHNMNLVKKLSDYVIVLDHGTLLASGKPEEVLNNKLVQEAYLGV